MLWSGRKFIAGGQRGLALLSYRSFGPGLTQGPTRMLLPEGERRSAVLSPTMLNSSDGSIVEACHGSSSRWAAAVGRQWAARQGSGARRMATWAGKDVINLARYPIDEMGEGSKGRAAAKAAKETLERDGYVVLEKFIVSPAVKAMASDAVDASEGCFQFSSTHNIWGEDVSKHEHSKQYGAMSLRRREMLTGHGVIGCDELDEPSPLTALFKSEQLRAFLTEVTGGEVHRFVDEIGGCSVQVHKEGSKMSWRFAQHPVVVFVWLKGAKKGGRFRVLTCDVGEVEQGDVNDVVEEIRTLLDAMDCEEMARSTASDGEDVEIRLKDVLESMDVEVGAKIGVPVKELTMDEGSVLVWRRGKSLLSFSSVIHDKRDKTGALIGVMRFEDAPKKKLTISERKHLYGREYAGEERAFEKEDDWDQETDEGKDAADGEETYSGSASVDEDGVVKNFKDATHSEAQREAKLDEAEKLKTQSEATKSWKEEFGQEPLKP